MSSRKGKKPRANGMRITEYFEDRTVFITGATGFMGKVLLEKLLRSCPAINKIYILMRPKKDKSIEERLQAMFELPMFVKIKRNDPFQFNKIVALSGDVAQPNLGLSSQDIQILKDEVSVVFHVAATVRFDDKLKNAVFMNLRGTVEALKIAEDMKKLDVFLHMSTAYCIKHREETKEMLYPPPADWRQILKITENLDEYSLEVLGPILMDHYPNTYTFTKALAEQAVADYSDRIPAVIFRPSIVISAVSEPLPGWVDNFNGPIALIVAGGKGIVRVVYTNPQVTSDFIPVDLCVKAMLVVVWNHATALEPTSEVAVYNAAAGGIKAITQHEMMEMGYCVAREVPLNEMLWIPGGTATKCKANFYLQFFLLHLIPAILVDTLLKYLDKKPILVRIQRKIFVANTALEHFITRQWNFENKKLIKMDSEILEKDREAFSYYKPEIDPYEYFLTGAYGGRQFLMKEDNTDLDNARKTYKRMYWVDKVAKVLFIILVAYLAVKLNIVSGIRNCLISFIESLVSIIPN